MHVSSSAVHAVQCKSLLKCSGTSITVHTAEKTFYGTLLLDVMIGQKLPYNLCHRFIPGINVFHTPSDRPQAMGKRKTTMKVGILSQKSRNSVKLMLLMYPRYMTKCSGIHFTTRPADIALAALAIPYTILANPTHLTPTQSET